MKKIETNKTPSRRLSAIMFTDMVGYSAMVQENEQAALELLDKHRDILRNRFVKCHGREIETVGDAFFVEFNSALEAVQCAIEIQTTLYKRNKDLDLKRWIWVRIGIHVGDVIYRENQVLGDCVNIAARMEPLAVPGGICLSEDAARQVFNKIDLPLKNLGNEELKNIRLPIKIFKVVLPWEKPSKQANKKLQYFTKSKKKPLIFLFTLLVTIIILIYFSNMIVNEFSLFKDDSSLDRQLKRIAVLPFDNYSPDQRDDYIADGLTEEIIAVLSKIKNLHVIARTSVMKYKYEPKDIAEIAKDLNVGTVLEGSIRKDNNRIRVTAQLIESKAQEHLWAESYDKELIQIFDLQTDIAFKIAQALQITLMDIEKSNIEKRSTQNITAYNAYLKGRYYWNMRTPENLVKGMEYFQYAIEADSSFALAYAGIADSYHLMCSYGALPPKVGFPKAKEAALMAIEMDDNLAEGYNALAAINLLYAWDWDASEQGFKKALELNPRYVQAYSWYALYYQVQKEFGKALELIEKAITLDPLSAISRTDLGQVNYHAGNYKQAIVEYQKSLELDSNYVYTYAYLGQAYAMSGKEAAAEKAFAKAVHLTGEKDPATLSGLAYVYAMRGKTEQARSIIARLTAVENQFYVHPMYVSSIYAALSEIDQAIAWLEKGFYDRSEWMIYLQIEHMLQPLYGVEKFKNFVKKMNFKQPE